LTFTERVTRYAMAITMAESYDATATLVGLVEGLDRIPAGLLRSVNLEPSGAHGPATPGDLPQRPRPT
jgi:hypothetical protein